MSNNKVRWGVLGAARIAVNKVIPAMQKGQWSEVVAIASRDSQKAEGAAQMLGISKAYGSYDEILRDSEIEAVYIPLPNHLHVPWTVKSAEAGKHVLCEKPLSLTVAEARTLLSVRNRTEVKIGEAFMIRNHPQWFRARKLVTSGRIGELRSILGFFSYFNRDASNIRNVEAYGGGALMDIGCYPIHVSRFMFGEEPSRVMGLIDLDPSWKIDRLTSAILDFPRGQSVFTCGTPVVPYQRVQLMGTDGRIEIQIPFNTPNDQPARIFIDTGTDLSGKGITEETFPACDQYTLQGDAFSKAIRGQGDVPVGLENAIANMSVIEAIFRSAQSGVWEKPQQDKGQG